LTPIYESSGLAEYGVDSVEKFLSFFLMGEEKLDEWLKGLDKINTDDLPRAHFNSTLNKEGIQNCLDMLEYQESIAPYLTGMGDRETEIKKTLENYILVSQLLTRGFLTSNQLEYEKAGLMAAEKNLADDKNVSCMLKYDPKRKEYFLKRIKQNPGEATSHYHLGFIYAKEKSYLQAVEEFKRAISLKPDFARAYMDLANTYMDSGMYDQAVDELMKLRELNPTGEVLYIVGTRLNMIHLLRKISYQPKDASLYFTLGRAYLENGEFTRASEALFTAVQIQPGDPKALELLGVVYESLELLDKALDVYRRLAALVPEDPGIKQKIDQLAAIQTDGAAKRQWLSSKLVFTENKNTHPEDCALATKKWTSYKFDGKIDRDSLMDVALAFEKVIKKHKDHMHAYSDAAAIYESFGMYKKAASLWEEGLKVSPGNEKAVDNINRLLLLAAVKNKDISKTDRVESYNTIGLMYWKNNEIELAVEYFKKALEIDPQQVDVLANLGAAYSDCGKYRDAIDTLEQALKLSPNIQFRDQVEKRIKWIQSAAPGGPDPF
jgi:tetratricopeptide (TPR) repeat protein